MPQGQEELQFRPGATAGADERLESWKEIAAFLGRGVRTVQRWEEVEGLPVHRHVHGKGGTVFGLKSEIQEWYARREIAPTTDAGASVDAPSVVARIEEPKAGSAPAPTAASASVRPRLRRKALVATGILAGIALFELIAFRSSRPHLRTGSPVTVISQVGRISQTVVSPSGDRVVYCWNGDREENNLDLYIRDIRTSTTRRLTTNRNNDHSGAWAPDSTRVAFLRDNEGVFVTDPRSGGEKRLETAHRGATYAVGMSWSPDGRFLAYSEKPSAAKPSSVYVLNIAEGTRRVMTEPVAGGPGDMYPSFSPDGQFIAFVRHYGGIESDVYRILAGGGNGPVPKPEKLTSEQRWIAGFDWAPGGAGVIYSSPRTGARRLWFQPVSYLGWPGWGLRANQPEPLSEAGDDAWQPTIARGSGAIAYSRRYWTSSIWNLQLNKSEGAPVLRRLIASTRVERDPAYSPDGGLIAFVSERSGNTEVWISDAEGHNEVQLTRFRHRKVDSPAWSRDGKWIAASVAGQGAYIVPAGGGEARRITPESMPCTNPTWSPDGTALACVLGTNNGDEIWRVPVTSGASERVTAGSRPQFGRDGNWLYFTRRGELWRVMADREPERLIPAPVGSYAVVSDGVFFDHGSGDYTRASVKFYRFQTGTTELISNFDLKKSGGLAVSPDGESLLVPLNERQLSELLLIN